MRRWKTYTVRGTHVCLAVGSLDLIFDPDEARDVADELVKIADTLDRRPAVARDRHLDDSELSGGSRFVGSSSDDGGQL